MAWLQRNGLTLFAAFVALMVLLPLGWMISVSFMSPGSASQFPPPLIPANPTLENYATLFGSYGIGRYLQGLDGSGAGVVSPDAEIDTRRAWGGSASYEHPWSATLSSNFVAGTASARPAAYQGSGTFERSDFLAANLLLRTSRYTTVGVEYVYGQRRNVGQASRHNQQVVLGLQVF